MVVEHVFVTTYEPTDAMRIASYFLSRRGFEPVTQAAFQLGQPGWTVLEMRRGRSSPTRAKSAVEVPQQMRLEYDRGRVTVAASGLSAKEAVNRAPKGKDGDELRAMLLALAQNMQYLLADRVDPEALYVQWSNHEDAIRDAGLRRRRTRLTVLWTLLGVLIALIVLIITLAVMEKRH